MSKETKTVDYEETDAEGVFHGKEPFLTIIKRACAKKRDGEPLTQKERWALDNQYCPPTGPTPATLKFLERVAGYQIGDGLSHAQIALTEGCSLSKVAKYLKKYPVEYRRACLKYEEDLRKEAGVRRTVVGARVLQKMAQAALKSADKIEELMDSAQQERVQLDAAIHTQKVFGLSGEQNQFAESKTKLIPVSAEVVGLLTDTLALLKPGRDLQSSPAEVLPPVLDAEVVE